MDKPIKKSLNPFKRFYNFICAPEQPMFNQRTIKRKPSIEFSYELRSNMTLKLKKIENQHGHLSSKIKSTIQDNQLSIQFVYQEDSLYKSKKLYSNLPNSFITDYQGRKRVNVKIKPKQELKSSKIDENQNKSIYVQQCYQKQPSSKIQSQVGNTSKEAIVQDNYSVKTPMTEENYQFVPDEWLGKQLEGLVEIVKNIKTDCQLFIWYIYFSEETEPFTIKILQYALKYIICLCPIQKSKKYEIVVYQINTKKKQQIQKICKQAFYSNIMDTNQYQKYLNQQQEGINKLGTQFDSDRSQKK